jgi:hypothetical protein
MGRDAAKSVWALFVDIIGLGGFQSGGKPLESLGIIQPQAKEDLGI